MVSLKKTDYKLNSQREEVQSVVLSVDGKYNAITGITVSSDPKKDGESRRIILMVYVKHTDVTYVGGTDAIMINYYDTVNVDETAFLIKEGEVYFQLPKAVELPFGPQNFNSIDEGGLVFVLSLKEKNAKVNSLFLMAKEMAQIESKMSDEEREVWKERVDAFRDPAAFVEKQLEARDQESSYKKLNNKQSLHLKKNAKITVEKSFEVRGPTEVVGITGTRFEIPEELKKSKRNSIEIAVGWSEASYKDGVVSIPITFPELERIKQEIEKARQVRAEIFSGTITATDNQGKSLLVMITLTAVLGILMMICIIQSSKVYPVKSI